MNYQIDNNEYKVQSATKAQTSDLEHDASMNYLFDSVRSCEEDQCLDEDNDWYNVAIVAKSQQNWKEILVLLL